MGKLGMYQNLAFYFLWISCFLLHYSAGHEAKDFDDTILYKIDFEIPDFDQNPVSNAYFLLPKMLLRLYSNQELKNDVRTFYTHEREKYDCVIPSVMEPKEETKSDEPELCKLEDCLCTKES